MHVQNNQINDIYNKLILYLLVYYQHTYIIYVIYYIFVVKINKFSTKTKI